MKKIYFVFLLALFSIPSALSQENRLFNFIDSDISVTNKKHNTLVVSLDILKLDYLYSVDRIFVNIPTIDKKFINIELKSFSVTSPNHVLIIQRDLEQNIDNYESNFKSYYMYFEGERIGVLIFFQESIIVSYKFNNRQFEINTVNDNLVLFDVNDYMYNHSFTCEVEEKRGQISAENRFSESTSSTPKCLELAIEIDKYTRNTFNSSTAATNWAHAIIAGVNQVYDSEVNMNITIVNTIIWETTDPYSSYVNNASSMLSALRNHWMTNNSSISRDLVHLMTKRNNTGTGGIAYRDVLCSNSWGYAFSANLNNNTNFNFPNPSYTWNLMVCSHEIGHNIESHHTHWCGWPGGPIDNCVDVEGSCTNNPTPQVGTIMSYCHTTSSGSLIDFHPTVVNSALNPGINGASCLTACAFYGCTDPNATNYDPNATVDDGSCTYAPATLSAIVNNISCNGLDDGSIDLNVSGGLAPYSYIWSNGSFTEDINNLSSGSYSVSVTDALGQVSTGSYIIVEPTQISAIYTVSNTSGLGMSDGSISVSASGGVSPYTYYWIGYTSTSSTLNNLSSGIYVSYVLDANNCYIIDSVEVLDNIPDPLALTSLVTNVNCFGNSTGEIDLTVIGGTPPYTYNWNNSSTSQDIFNLSAGIYIVNVMDGQGQNISDTITVIEPGQLYLSYIIANESYSGASDGSIDLTVFGGIPPFSY